MMQAVTWAATRPGRKPQSRCLTATTANKLRSAQMPADPVMITAAALVAKGFETAAGEAGRSAWTGMGRLLGLVRNKLRGDRQGQQALASVETAPANQASVETLAEIIASHATKDHQFREMLRELVVDAEQHPTIGRFVVEVSEQAKIGKLVNIDTVHGDVSF
jgi:hypothetical protein